MKSLILICVFLFGSCPNCLNKIQINKLETLLNKYGYSDITLVPYRQPMICRIETPGCIPDCNDNLFPFEIKVSATYKDKRIFTKLCCMKEMNSCYNVYDKNVLKFP